jgi:hypothetical protein
MSARAALSQAETLTSAVKQASTKDWDGAREEDGLPVRRWGATVVGGGAGGAGTVVGGGGSRDRVGVSTCAASPAGIGVMAAALIGGLRRTGDSDNIRLWTDAGLDAINAGLGAGIVPR